MPAKEGAAFRKQRRLNGCVLILEMKRRNAGPNIAIISDNFFLKHCYFYIFRSWYLSSNRVQSVKVMCSHLASIPSLCWCWWCCRWCWWSTRVCIMMVMMILCGRRLAGWRKPNLFCLVATRFWSWTSWLPTCYSWTWLFRSPPEYICIYIWISVIIISAPR